MVFEVLFPSVTNSVFFSDDDPGLAGLSEEFEVAFRADCDKAFRAHCDKAFRAHCDEAFRAHCENALKADPNNPLLREAIELGLSLL